MSGKDRHARLQRGASIASVKGPPFEVQERKPSSVFDESNAVFLAIKTALKDGLLNESEHMLIDSFRRSAGLDSSLVSRFIAEESERVSEAEHRKEDDFLKLVRLLGSDGDVSKAERELLQSTAVEYKFGSDRMTLLVNRGLEDVRVNDKNEMELNPNYKTTDHSEAKSSQRVDRHSPDVVTVEVSGEASGGMKSSVEEVQQLALQNAIRRAVERAIGVTLESETLTNLSQISKDQIASRAGGLVKILEVIEEDTSYDPKIRAIHTLLKVRAEVQRNAISELIGSPPSLQDTAVVTPRTTRKPWTPTAPAGGFDETLTVAALKAATANNFHLAQELILKGADPNASGKDGNSLLMIASNRGAIELVDALLASGADANARTDSYWTALMYAALDGRAGCASLLLKAGANPNLLSDGRYGALTIAAFGGHSGIIEELIEYGVEVDYRGASGMSALMHAAQNGHANTVKFLIDRGADIHAKANNGRTALIAAVLKSRSQVVTELLGNGADINSITKHGQTPLIEAVIVGSLEMVELLLERGADKTIRDKAGNTAYDYAKAKGYKKLARIIKRH
jgi:ankyrin repeat protein